MFKINDEVEVYFLFPGQTEPLWHKGKVVQKLDDSYEIYVGGHKTRAAVANIRKV